VCECGLDSSGSVQGPVKGSCEHGNERTGSKESAERLSASQWETGLLKNREETLFHVI